jgi:hypothetical protein
MTVGEAFPTGPEFLLAKSSFPSLKTPTVLSQQELGNPVWKAFANRVGVFANSFPVVNRKGVLELQYQTQEHYLYYNSIVEFTTNIRKLKEHAYLY